MMDARRKSWGREGEPRLAEVLGDPVVALVMRADGVTRSALEALLATATARLGAPAAA